MVCLVQGQGQEQVRGEQHGGLRDYGLPNHNTLSSYHQQNLNFWIAKNLMIFKVSISKKKNRCVYQIALIPTFSPSYSDNISDSKTDF